MRSCDVDAGVGSRLRVPGLVNPPFPLFDFPPLKALPRVFPGLSPQPEDLHSYPPEAVHAGFRDL